MASGPITSGQTDGETVETVSDFIFLGFKITADGGCSHEIKRHLLFGRKVMTNLSSVHFSRLVVSSSLRPHESQHIRPPYPSPSPGVHSEKYGTLHEFACHPCAGPSYSDLKFMV